MVEQILRGNNSDFVVSLLRSQLSVLSSVIQMIEDNEINREIVTDNLKQVERDVRWLRRSCFDQ